MFCYLFNLKKSSSEPSLFKCNCLFNVASLLLKDVMSNRDVKSRLSDTNLIDDIIKKLSLPTSYFTKLVILEVHEEVFYTGIDIAMNKIQNKYWILSGHQTVRKVNKLCAICKRFQGKPAPFTTTVTSVTRL